MYIVGSRVFAARFMTCFRLLAINPPPVTVSASLRALIASLKPLSNSTTLVEFVDAVYCHGIKLKTHFLCWKPAFFPYLRRALILRIPEHCDPGEFGHGFLEQFQSFDGQH